MTIKINADIPGRRVLWLVESGDYDDHGPDAVFSTEEKAKAAIAAGLGEDINEIVFDPPLDLPPDGLEMWRVEINADVVTWMEKEKVKRVAGAMYRWPSEMRLSCDPKRWNGEIWATDEIKAAAIARNLIQSAQ